MKRADDLARALRTPSASRSMIECLERRSLLSHAVGVGSSPPPVVNAVYVMDTEWTLQFRNAVQYFGAGDPDLGVGVGSATAPPLPWTNVNQITITFSADMVVEARHLRVFGTNVAEYPVTSLTYRVNPLNFNGIATWTLGRPLSADKILLQLDAHSPDGVRMAGNPVDPPLLDGDGDGRPGGDFRLRFQSLPGDVGGAYRVDAADVASVRSFVLMSVGDTQPLLRNPFFDINADGQINVQDMTEVRRRVGTTLPYWEPTGSLTAQATTSAHTRPVSRGLFSSQPILS